MMDQPLGPKAPKVTRDALTVGVEIDISDLAQRLQAEAMRLINDLTQQGITGDELASRVEAGLMDLSDKPIQDAARGAASESFNLGRNLSAQDNLEGITEVVRTEILDGNTCDYCRSVDQTVVEINSDEYFQLMPPNGCYGRDFCRGFYMYLEAA